MAVRHENPQHENIHVRLPKGTVPTFNSCTKCVGSAGKIHDHTPDCQPVSWVGMHDDLATERRFDSQATWVIDMLGLFFDMQSMGVCTSRHWQTSGRQMQKLSVGTVLVVGTRTASHPRVL